MRSSGISDYNEVRSSFEMSSTAYSFIYKVKNKFTFQSLSVYNFWQHYYKSRRFFDFLVAPYDILISSSYSSDSCSFPICSKLAFSLLMLSFIFNLEAYVINSPIILASSLGNTWGAYSFLTKLVTVYDDKMINTWSEAFWMRLWWWALNASNNRMNSSMLYEFLP